MKQLLLFSFLFLLVAIPNEGNAVNSSKQKASLKKEDLEKQLGRKLKFKEKVALKLLQLKQKKQSKKQTTLPPQKFDEFAIAGFSSALLILLSLIIGQPTLFLIFTIAAIILSAVGIFRTQGLKGFRKRGRGLAIIGLVGGIIGAGLLVLVIIALSNL